MTKRESVLNLNMDSAYNSTISRATLSWLSWKLLIKNVLSARPTCMYITCFKQKANSSFGLLSMAKMLPGGPRNTNSENAIQPHQILRLLFLLAVSIVHRLLVLTILTFASLIRLLFSSENALTTRKNYFYLLRSAATDKPQKYILPARPGPSCLPWTR